MLTIEKIYLKMKCIFFFYNWDQHGSLKTRYDMIYSAEYDDAEFQTLLYTWKIYLKNREQKFEKCILSQQNYLRFF